MGDWVSEGELGGYYWKVVRWAYEKQGLFQPPGAPVPVTTVGVLPPIDVYIDDGRHGEYQYGPANQFPWMQRFWETTEIWNRLAARWTDTARDASSRSDQLRRWRNRTRWKDWWPAKRRIGTSVKSPPIAR